MPDHTTGMLQRTGQQLVFDAGHANTLLTDLHLFRSREIRSGIHQRLVLPAPKGSPTNEEISGDRRLTQRSEDATPVYDERTVHSSSMKRPLTMKAQNLPPLAVQARPKHQQ